MRLDIIGKRQHLKRYIHGGFSGIEDICILRMKEYTKSHRRMHKKKPTLRDIRVKLQNVRDKKS